MTDSSSARSRDVSDPPGPNSAPGIREDWFPTSIWYFDFENRDSINAQILPEILAERDRDPQGMTDRSSVLGWHSADNLHGRESFQPLVERIHGCVAEVIAFLRWDTAKVTPRLINCWAIANDKYSSNVVHNHPQSTLSGVYYVQAPENSGDLFFRDPREQPGLVDPPFTERTSWTFPTVIYKPQVGRLLIFPGWLLHGVEPNLSDETRVCVSFNVGFRWN